MDPQRLNSPDARLQLEIKRARLFNDGEMNFAVPSLDEHSNAVEEKSSAVLADVVSVADDHGGEDQETKAGVEQAFRLGTRAFPFP